MLIDAREAFRSEKSEIKLPTQRGINFKNANFEMQFQKSLLRSFKNCLCICALIFISKTRFFYLVDQLGLIQSVLEAFFDNGATCWKVPLFSWKVTTWPRWFSTPAVWVNVSIIPVSSCTTDFSDHIFCSLVLVNLKGSRFNHRVSYLLDYALPELNSAISGVELETLIVSF